MKNEAPYKSVLTHGFTVDAQGLKMSKSKGNVVSPQKVMKTLGADTLRLWVSATDYRGEMSVSDEILKRTSDAYRRIRNTARYLLANISGFDPEKDSVASEELLDLDRWVLQQTIDLQKEIITAYENYQFHLIYQKLHHFCGVTLSSFYLDIIKDRMYTMRSDSVARRSAQTVIFHITEAFVRWLAPVLSFTAEEIWRFLPGEHGESIFLEEWYTAFPDLSDSHDDDWKNLISVKDEVSKVLEKLRISGEIGSSLDAKVDIYCNGEIKESLEHYQQDLRFVLITSEANLLIDAEVPKDAVSCELDGVSIAASLSTQEKCIRCWHHREDVGSNPEHPEICERCVTNVTGEGEVRLYA